MPITPPAEYLEVASIPLVFWIETTFLEPLWDGADVNDEDLHVDRASGERELPQYLQPLVGVLPAVMYGDRDRSGNTVSGLADCRQNLYDNIAYLKENVCVVPGGLPSSRACVLHLPDGMTTLTGNIRISRRLDIRMFQGNESATSPLTVEVSLAFKVSLGELVESGS